jgi:hypothetical protein
MLGIPIDILIKQFYTFSIRNKEEQYELYLKEHDYRYLFEIYYVNPYFKSNYMSQINW